MSPLRPVEGSLASQLLSVSLTSPTNTECLFFVGGCKQRATSAILYFKLSIKRCISTAGSLQNKSGRKENGLLRLGERQACFVSKQTWFAIGNGASKVIYSIWKWPRWGNKNPKSQVNRTRWHRSREHPGVLSAGCRVRSPEELQQPVRLSPIIPPSH